MTGILLSLLGGKVSVEPDPYFEYTTLLLPGNGTNGAQNNTFLDGSTNNFTITRNGNTTQGTFSPFSQTGWGNYFSGSQSISIAATASLQYSGDFTIECWFYKNATGDATTFIQQSGSNYFAMNVNPGTGINIYLNNASANFIITDRVPQPNTWHHIALVRSGSASGNIKCYLDGVASTTTATNTSTLGYNAIGYLGAIGTASGGSFVGYISNFRIASGRAVYTSNFTPPTTPLTRTTGGTNPPQGSETIWLTAQSNRFLDSDGVNTPASSPLTITVNGSPSVVAFSPFNPTASWSAATYGGSGYFDGSGDYLSANSAGLELGSNLFTIDGWFYCTGYNGGGAIYSSVNTYPSSTGLLFYVNNVGTYTIDVNGSNVILSGTAPLNAWTHFAIVRSSTGANGVTLYINGSSIATGTSATNFSSTYAVIGRTGFGAASNYWLGYLSGIRVVVGSANVPSGVPTSPPTAITNTSLLLNFTNAGIYDATSKNDLETVGNAQISTTQSKWGGSSMYFDGNGDYSTAPSTILEQFGTANFTIEFWFYKAANGAFNYGDSTGDFILRIGNAGFTTNSIVISTNNSQQITAFIGYNGSSWATTIVSSSTFSLNTWYYCALVRSGTGANQTALYVNGTSYGTATNSTNLTDASFGTVLRLGASGSDRYFNGYLQDFRITNGYARTVTTSPTAAFPTL